MKLTYRFRNCDSSEGIKTHAEAKLEKLSKYLDDDFTADIVAAVEKHHTHRIEIDVHCGSQKFSAHHESHDMYNSFDEAVAKLQTQIRKDKEAHASQRRAGGHGLVER